MSEGAVPESNPQETSLGLDAFRDKPEDAGLSLDELSEAFAKALGAGADPFSAASDEASTGGEGGNVQFETEPMAAPGEAIAPDSCEITPRSILEAMLFVGSPTNEPLASAKVSSLMRGVRPAEIDELVRELNQQYKADGCPYRIESEGAGYRMALRPEFEAVRGRFYGRVREARLSPAAIEVLAVVAYNQPLSREEVSQLRGKPSGSLLAQLVRRQLVRIERPEESPRIARYHTTGRFLKLLGIAGLDDLPRGEVP
jgi:segregation and condensation protein B